MCFPIRIILSNASAIFKFMMLAVKHVLLILLISSPIVLMAQSAGNELPLPLVKGAGMVVRTYFSFMPPTDGSTRFDKDTESLYIIARDGLAATRYIAEGGRCVGMERYRYSEGKLVHRAYFKSLSKHGLFAPPGAHNHRLVREDSFEYAGGKLVKERHFAGVDKVLTREIRNEYDRNGRMYASYYEYPKQSLVYYPNPYDAVEFRYSGDSVYRFGYRQGRICDSSTFLERLNAKGLLVEKCSFSTDGKQVERALRRYDSADRVIELESISSSPAVAPDGTILRADRVEYTYDEKGRPDETRYFARGLKRWIYKYGYLN